MTEEHDIVVLANGLFPSGQRCKQILEGANIVITIANNGQEAVKRV